MPSVDLRLLRLAIGDHRREQAATHIEPFSASSLDYTSVPADFDSELGITKLRDGILFDLDFETTVVGPCQRCLGEARLELAIDGREYQADAPTPDGDAETTPYLTGEVLDLDDWARDAVILALPLVITCASRCKGLCAQCGANLNVAACDCDGPPPDERWSVLRTIETDARTT